MNITNQPYCRRYPRSWLSYGLILAVLLPLLAACMGDDDDDPGASSPGAESTLTLPLIRPTESEDTAEEISEQATEEATEDPAESETATATGEEAMPSLSTEQSATIADTTATETEAEPEAETTATSGEPAVPGDRPIDRQLSWLLGVINSDVPPVEEVEARMHPSFIAEIPPADFATLLGQLIQSGPWTFSGYLGSPVALDGAAIVDSQAGRFQLIVGLEVPEPNRFQTLLFIPDPAPSLTLASFAEIDPLLAELAPQISFQVAEISEGVCQPIHTVNADQPLAIASGFKHWVLLELAERVAAGQLAWDDEVTVTDDLKSLSSGTLQTEPAGSSFALSTYAAKMMVLSDNTATDHLIGFLGREAVEERMTATGNSAMERNTPLLLTRELFYLKLVASAEERDAYVAADDAGQRAILDGLVVDFSQLNASALGLPVDVDSIEWFASATDLCAVQAALLEAAHEDETLRSILAASAGVDLDEARWPFIAFKGGDEAGVAARSWLLEHSNGRVFSINVTLNNPDTNVDPSGLDDLAQAVAGLLEGME